MVQLAAIAIVTAIATDFFISVFFVVFFFGLDLETLV